ncbi:MAG: hypothetical protein K2N88_02630 [Muribaculaceae bacterium]|nr:hypothetical protein [Muribaculaceae bacterium]
MKCKDCQNYLDYYKCCDPKKEQVDPDGERVCDMTKSIIGRELWIARQEWGDLSIYLCKPYYDGKWGRENWTVGMDAPVFPDGSRSMSLPSYLYPEITFENSPQKLELK